MYIALVIEENDVLREKIAGLLSREPNIGLVAQLKSPEAFIGDMSKIFNPDLIVMRIRKSFLEPGFIDSFKIGNPGREVMLFTEGMEEEYQAAAQRAGADIITGIDMLTQSVQACARRHCESKTRKGCA